MMLWIGCSRMRVSSTKELASEASITALLMKSTMSFRVGMIIRGIKDESREKVVNGLYHGLTDENGLLKFILHPSQFIIALRAGGGPLWE